jgi:serine/threonine-protein kinase
LASTLTHIGRYTVERRIGAGGMAVTWLCRLDGIGGFQKLVLIKVLHQKHLGNESYVQMFLDEARLSALLTHPNISQVFEVGEQDGVPFFVMEYVPGPNLSKVVKKIPTEGPRPYGHLAWITACVCRALAYAHGLRDDDGKVLKIIHRDVSLGNILIAPSGAVKLIDFGIASSDIKRNVTEVGMIKGKLHYMAPEQLSDQVDHRVDIYQTGVCLYWMATGIQPFQNENPAAVWRDRLEGKLRLPSTFVPDFPPVLEGIIRRALAPSPDDRWQSASDMADELEAFCHRSPAYHSSERDVAGWVCQLFTETELAAYRAGSSDRSGSGNTGLHTHGGSTVLPAPDEVGPQPAPAPARPVTAPPPVTPAAAAAPAVAPAAVAAPPVILQERGRSGVLSAVTGAAVMFSLLIGIAWWSGLGPGPSRSGGATGIDEKPNETARIYLVEAERLAGERRPGEAEAMLDKARAAQPTDAALDVQISQLASTLWRERRLSEGQSAFEAGDFAGALSRGRDLLDRDPEDPDAQALLRAVREQLRAEGAEGEEAEREASREAERESERASRQAAREASRARSEERAAGKDGRLNIQGEPGASVYLDDELVGQLPLSGLRLPVGRHQIHLRKSGFRTVERDITVRGSEQVNLRLELEPASGAEVAGASSEVAAAQGEVSATSSASAGRSAASPSTGGATAAGTLTGAAATTAPAPPESAPPRAASTLPGVVKAQSMYDVHSVLTQAEQDAIKRGVPPSAAAGATARLEAALNDQFPPPDVYTIRPRSISDLIVGANDQGLSPGSIATEILRQHQ